MMVTKVFHLTQFEKANSKEVMFNIKAFIQLLIQENPIICFVLYQFVLDWEEGRRVSSEGERRKKMDQRREEEEKDKVVEEEEETKAVREDMKEEEEKDKKKVYTKERNDG